MGSGEQAKDLWNGGQSPEPLELSQIDQCKDDFGQAPNKRKRRVRRQKNGVCLPKYLNEPETVQTHKVPTNFRKGPIGEQQDRPQQQKTPGAPPSIKPDSPPILGGETLVGPTPESNICKDPARPIPVCHSGVDAVYSIVLPWIADRLPNCHAICKCFPSLPALISSQNFPHTPPRDYKIIFRIIRVRLIPHAQRQR